MPATGKKYFHFFMKSDLVITKMTGEGNGLQLISGLFLTKKRAEE